MSDDLFIKNIFEVANNILTKNELETFLLYYKEAYSESEIAAIQGIAQQNVSKKIIKSVNKIKKFMEV